MARKILLADDSVTAQNMGRRILTDAGYEVVTVNNGSAALKRIAESKPDLIVLDVYMPGYGGLEVCQRIRETQETARIPVLLTVGKLEPFKPEEVRRVRADAFIVKPFEASELLTALTKLEDKIVPQPAPYKPGRFAKAMAAIEETGIPEYGDLEKGWKNRLKIPPPDRKPREDEDEETAVSSSQSHQTPASPETSAAPTAAMLRGVTAEEIAAIEAAAAIFSGRAKESSETPSPAEEKPATSRSDQGDSEETAAPVPEASVEAAVEPPMTFAAAPTVESPGETSPAEVEVQASAPEEAATSAPAETFQVAPAEQAIPESGADSVSDSTSEDRASEAKVTHEDEVTAALASLAPSNGHGAAAGSMGVEPGQAFSGPRWIAESVPLTEDESSITLDEEMQRALAAFAAADAAREIVAFPAAEPVAAASSESSEAAQTASVAQAEEFLGIPSTTDAVAAPVAAPPEAAVSEVPEEAAYAAAASAGAVAAEPNLPTEMSLSHVGLPEIPESTSSVELVDQQRESELAAAWASWKQVRDSIAGDQLTSQIADAAAAGLQDLSTQETTATPEPAPQASAAPEESGAIASIVDSVLAELKPKLMEEIAKKMKK